MSFVVKTELLTGTDIVSLSSEEEEFNLDNASHDTDKKEPPERPRTPDTHCSICLEQLSNKCYADSCWHMFCFECLKRWSIIDPSCPLCKKVFSKIFHSINEDQAISEIYEVPLLDRSSPRIFIRPFADVNNFSTDVTNRAFRMNLFLDMLQRSGRMRNDFGFSGVSDLNHNFSLPNAQMIDGVSTGGYDRFAFSLNRVENYGHAMRTRVYQDSVWAEPLPDLSGRFRECTAAFYRGNPAQAHRLHSFVMRDIIAIRSLVLTDPNIALNLDTSHGVLVQLVLETIMHYEIRSGCLADTLQQYLGVFSRHFCHELWNYANSPYDMVGYDRHVRYSSRENHSLGPHLDAPRINITDVFEVAPLMPEAIPIPNFLPLNETIVLDTDSDDNGTNLERFVNDVIVLTSTEDDSEVEIISHEIHPVERLDTFTRDQPSTSTGIRDSLNRSNNSRYNLRRRRFDYTPSNPSPDLTMHRIPRAYQSGVMRAMSENLISSSSTDDESVHEKFGVVRRRKQKVKKRQVKRRKRNVDARPWEFAVRNRNQSLSESSSSSDDSDTRTNNYHTPIRTNIAL